jgi:hypothetical protein
MIGIEPSSAADEKLGCNCPAFSSPSTPTLQR